jgi:hypothetical protein
MFIYHFPHKKHMTELKEKQKKEYPKTLKEGVIKILENKEIFIGRIGNEERWYKSPDLQEEFDGDSLYLKNKHLMKNDYEIIDGLNIDTVGLFEVYEKTYREIEINNNIGFMVAYVKIRELSKNNDKEITLNLLIGDLEGEVYKVEQLSHDFSNIMSMQPLLPEVYVNDEKNEIYIVKAVKEKFVSGVERTVKKLSDYGIELHKEIDVKERINAHIKEIMPRLGCDYTYNPVFPGERKDVCAARSIVEDGFSTGYDIVHLVWIDKEGKINSKEVKDTRETGKYIQLEEIKEEKDKFAIIYLDGSVDYVNKKELNLSS